MSSKQLSSHVLTVAGIRVRNALQVLNISFWVDMDFTLIFSFFLDNLFGFLGVSLLIQVRIYEKVLHLIFFVFSTILVWIFYNFFGPGLHL